MKNILFTLALLVCFNSFGQTEEVIQYYDSGGIQFKVNYVDGKKHGEEIWYHENGVIMEKVNYVDDVQQGEQINYSDSGAIIAKRNFLDGMAHGKWTRYYESGAVEWEANYLYMETMGRSVVQGAMIWYYRNGEIDMIENYKDGVLIED